jgi:DNA repair exonuclease SbcCD ATPase subunit
VKTDTLLFTMGDPFSVAGTAVGIISLGLQTCQILHKYCSEFKSFSRDVEAVQRQVRGLQGILEGLQGVKERLEIDNHAPSSQLHMALKECEETLHELRSMVDKRNTTSQPEGIHTQLRVVKERLLWPYRKEDLKEVQSSLARFQDNLALALQCAGLDGAVRQLEDLRSELKSQLQQLINMEQTLTQGTEILEMFRRDFASQSPMLSNICNELVSLNTQISEYKAFVRNENQTVRDSSHEPWG